MQPTSGPGDRAPRTNPRPRSSFLPSLLPNVFRLWRRHHARTDPSALRRDFVRQGWRQCFGEVARESVPPAALLTHTPATIEPAPAASRPYPSRGGPVNGGSRSNRSAASRAAGDIRVRAEVRQQSFQLRHGLRRVDHAELGGHPAGLARRSCRRPRRSAPGPKDR